MWIPVFSEKQVFCFCFCFCFCFFFGKWVSLKERKPNLWKLKLVYKVQRCLGNSELKRKQEFFCVANSTCPIGQVLLEIHSSEIREYSSRTGGQVEVFCTAYKVRHLIRSVIKLHNTGQLSLVIVLHCT